jgi:hypothetical protein
VDRDEEDEIGDDANGVECWEEEGKEDEEVSFVATRTRIKVDERCVINNV